MATLPPGVRREYSLDAGFLIDSSGIPVGFTRNGLDYLMPRVELDGYNNVTRLLSAGDAMEMRARGWRDMTATVQPKTTGVGAPTRAAYAGANLNQYAFIANDLCEFEFHLPHDYIPNTDLYFHVHWSHNGTTTTGNATFTNYVTYAKGHQQAAFPAEKTIAITHATTNIATTPRYQHMISEIAITGAADTATTFDRSTIEVDGLVLLTLKLTSLPTLGGGGKLFIHTCDLHYESNSQSTLNKSPNFYA